MTSAGFRVNCTRCNTLRRAILIWQLASKNSSHRCR
jgi:hypothetical protein